MRDEEVQKSKQMFVASLTSSFSSLPLILFIIHPSSFILFSSPLGVMRPARFVTWQRICPIGQTNTSPCFSPPCSSLRTTGQSHLALSKRRVSYGGDSQARCLSGAAIRRSHLHPAHTLFMNTVGLFSGFNSRRDD